MDSLQASLNTKADGLVKTTLDLAALDVNIWYSVTFEGLRATEITTFRVVQNLGNRGHQPNWAAHSSKLFSLLCEWLVNANGWGMIAVQRVVQAFEFAWVNDNKSPIIKIGQLSNGSIEYYCLRGGGEIRCVCAGMGDCGVADGRV